MKMNDTPLLEIEVPLSLKKGDEKFFLIINDVVLECNKKEWFTYQTGFSGYYFGGKINLYDLQGNCMEIQDVRENSKIFLHKLESTYKLHIR